MPSHHIRIRLLHPLPPILYISHHRTPPPPPMVGILNLLTDTFALTSRIYPSNPALFIWCWSRWLFQWNKESIWCRNWGSRTWVGGRQKDSYIPRACFYLYLQWGIPLVWLVPLNSFDSFHFPLPSACSIDVFFRIFWSSLLVKTRVPANSAKIRKGFLEEPISHIPKEMKWAIRSDAMD